MALLNVMTRRPYKPPSLSDKKRRKNYSTPGKVNSEPKPTSTVACAEGSDSTFGFEKTDWVGTGRIFGGIGGSYDTGGGPTTKSRGEETLSQIGSGQLSYDSPAKVSQSQPTVEPHPTLLAQPGSGSQLQTLWISRARSHS